MSIRVSALPLGLTEHDLAHLDGKRVWVEFELNNRFSWLLPITPSWKAMNLGNWSSRHNPILVSTPQKWIEVRMKFAAYCVTKGKGIDTVHCPVGYSLLISHMPFYTPIQLNGVITRDIHLGRLDRHWAVQEMIIGAPWCSFCAES